MKKIKDFTGIPTKEKAEKIVRRRKLLHPTWIMTIVGEKPNYIVKTTIPISEAHEESTSTNDVIDFLNFIAERESYNNYNAYYGEATNTDNPSFILMQLKEVLDWQKGRKFSACGKYQIIRATLLDLVRALSLNSSEIFDRVLQDKLGRKLLEGRGLDKFLNGELSEEDFAYNVACEWASLPKIKGKDGHKSVYDGDGNNKALVSKEVYMNAIRELKG